MALFDEQDFRREPQVIIGGHCTTLDEGEAWAFPLFPIRSSLAEARCCAVLVLGDQGTVAAVFGRKVARAVSFLRTVPRERLRGVGWLMRSR